MANFHGSRACGISGKALLMAAAAAVSVPAHAQIAAAPQDDAAPSSSEIVVTGSSIKGVAPVGAPVIALDAASLQRSGLGSATDLLRSVPQVLNLGADEGRGGTVQGAQINVTQAAAVNLRGLGTESTLLLLDGRRIAPGGAQANFYDMSVVPTGAIGRIELIADGASAIYGADAVGGVINLITKRRQNDLTTALRYSGGDGFHEWRGNAALGRTWSSGDLFVAYEYFERSPLVGSQRARVTQNLVPFGGPDLRANFANPGTIVVSGVTYAIPTGQNGRTLTAGQLVAGTQNRGEINDARSLLADQKRHSVFASLRQDLGDKARMWLSGGFSKRDFVGLGINLNSGAATAALTVPRSNAFFVHPTNPAATSVTVNYSFIKDMLPISRGFERNWFTAGGVNANVGGWDVDAYASYNDNIAWRLSEGNVRTVNLASALADSNPLTAFNPFCDGNAFQCNNPDTIARLNGTAIISGRLGMVDAVLKASGVLVPLPGGDVRLAVGGEYAHYSLTGDNIRNTATADFVTLRATPARSVKAVFGEVFVPLVGTGNALPGIERLSLSAAVRHEKFSDFGTTTNPKIGLEWSPLAGLDIRGSYGTSFRAPTMGDLSVANSASYQIVNFTDSNRATVRGIQLIGSREGLAPETAKTWSIGADLKPAALPGLRASVTFYHVDFKNRLTTPTAAQIFDNEAQLSAYIVRNPSSTLVQSFYASPYFASVAEPAANIKVILDTRRANLAAVVQAGLDLDLSYEFEAAGSTWQAGAVANVITEAKTRLAPGLAAINVLNTINNPVAFRSRGHLGWALGGWSADAYVNYTGSYRNDTVTPVQRVDAWTTLDASVSYRVGESAPTWLRNLRITLSAQNLTDAEPPLVWNTTLGNQGAYDSQNASVLGRTVAIGITKSW